MPEYCTYITTGDELSRNDNGTYSFTKNKYRGVKTYEYSFFDIIKLLQQGTIKMGRRNDS